MKIHSTFIVVLLASISMPSIAAAAESLTCSTAYEKAQEENTAGHLKAALVHLKSCVDPACPKFMRDDCLRWMDQAESAVPTVVFTARRDGKDLAAVAISCDGVPIVSSLDGKAVPVDPGRHNFSFTVPGLDPIARSIVIREGERNRIIEVDFKSAREDEATAMSTESATADRAAEPGQSGTVKRYLAYGLGGLAAVGIAGFAGFGIAGNNQKRDLERTCSPSCQASQVDQVKTKYVLADAFLGVGLVAAAVATYLFLTSHGESRDSRNDSISVGFAPRTSGAGGVVQVLAPF
jgi:hypothetical protein